MQEQRQSPPAAPLGQSRGDGSSLRHRGSPTAPHKELALTPAALVLALATQQQGHGRCARADFGTALQRRSHRVPRLGRPRARLCCSSWAGQMRGGSGRPALPCPALPAARPLTRIASGVVGLGLINIHSCFQV